MYKHVLSHSVMPNSLRPHGLHPTRLLCPWGFSREECWSGLPFPSPGDLPNPEVQPRPPTLQVDSLPAEQPGKPTYTHIPAYKFASLVAQLCKESSCNAGDPGSISGSGGSSGEGISSVQFSHSVVSDSLRPHESQHARPPCPSPTPQVHSDSHPSSR